MAQSSSELDGTDAYSFTQASTAVVEQATSPAEPADSAAATRLRSGLRNRRWLLALAWPAAVVAIALALSFWYYHKSWVHPRSYWTGGIGDPEQQMWFMSWPGYALSHGNNPLLTNYLQYPSGTNLMWNTSDVLPGLVMYPVTLLWGPVLSYNALMLLSAPATALTAYAAFRRWATRLGAACGGLLLAFSPFPIAHSSGHLHLVMMALLPLILLVLHEIVVRQSWRWWVSGAALGILATAQLVTAEELLTIAGIFAAIGIVLLALLHRHQIRDKFPYALRAGITALGVFLVTAGFPLYVQFDTSNKVSNAIHSDDVYVTDLLNPVVPTNQKYLAPHWLAKYVHNFSGNGAEWTGFIGLPLLVILVVLLIARWRQRPVVVFGALMSAIALLFSLGPWLHVDGHQYRIPLPFAVFSKLPVLRQLLPGRLSLVVLVFVALGLAVAVSEIQRARRLWLSALGVIAVAVVAWSWVPGELPIADIPTPAYFTSSDVDQIPAGSVALVLPYVSDFSEQHGMLWQAGSGMRFRMPEGWAIVPGDHAGPQSQTRYTFSSLTPVTTHITDAAATKIRAELRQWDVQTVIIGPYLNGPPAQQVAMRQAAIAVMTQILGRPPQQQGGVQVWYNVET